MNNLIIPTIRRIIRHMPHTIHIGERTHTQLQSILPRSLRTMNTIVSRPQKPMPPDDAEELLDILDLF